MNADRRTHLRMNGPFEAHWSGTSGQRRARATDIGVGGCFVEDLATPAVGDRVCLTVDVGAGLSIDVDGHVAYLYPSQGFAVAFDQDERTRAAVHTALRRMAR